MHLGHNLNNFKIWFSKVLHKQFRRFFSEFKFTRKFVLSQSKWNTSPPTQQSCNSMANSFKINAFNVSRVARGCGGRSTNLQCERLNWTNICPWWHFRKLLFSIPPPHWESQDPRVPPSWSWKPHPPHHPRHRRGPPEPASNVRLTKAHTFPSFLDVNNCFWVTSFFFSSASFSFLRRSASSSLGTGFQEPSWFEGECH